MMLSGAGHGRNGDHEVAFTSEDRVRDVIRNFNADGFSIQRAQAAVQESFLEVATSR